ncbi:TetR/AcrR family transcriptional regulator [Streptomyces sp. NPDC102462]|uniref:TetR/AcrR family transcriptional regulator n=1 Tax=Streptomyces sp. NPDC102462 TaxID=3366178 RepID=UPI00381E4B38
MEKRERPVGLREQKKRATRHALFEAAIRLAADNGVQQVTVEAISERAGVSPRTFFNYFKCREDAFVMADPEVGERIRQAVREAPAERSALDVLREAMAEQIAGMELDRDLWSLVALVLSRSPELTSRLLSLQAEEERALAEAFTLRLRAQGTTGPRAALYATLLASLSTAAIRVAMTHWYEHDGGTAFLDVFHQVFDQLAAGFVRPLDES